MLLRGATLLHLDPPRVEVADVRIDAGRIAEVAPQLAGDDAVDLRGQWLMPGLTVGHHHLYSALACGMPMPTESPPTFTALLEQIWWRLDRALDEQSVEISARVGGLQALRAGATTIIDHHASPSFIIGSLEAIDRGLDAVGQRRVLCYEVTDRNGPDGARDGLAAHDALLAATSDRRAVMIGAHANFTLSDETLRACGDRAAAAGVGIHIHVAEAVDDRQTTGEPLVARLERLGALLPGSILAHCIYLDGDELQRIEDAGAAVTHQARSNMNNDVGYAPLGHFGSRAAIGTDGIGGDLFAELQAGWFRSCEAGAPWSPLRWLEALSFNSRLAGEKLGVTLGVIEPGAAADLVVLDPIPGPPLTAENLPAAMIFRMSSSAVRHVMVDGAWRLRDGMPTGIDVGALDADARRSSVALWDRMRALP